MDATWPVLTGHRGAGQTLPTDTVSGPIGARRRAEIVKRSFQEVELWQRSALSLGSVTTVFGEQ